MIIEVNDALLDDVIAFAWEYQQCQETCSFPKYHSFEALKNGFLKSFNHDDDRILACIEKDELIGVLNLQVEKADLFLQAIGGIFAKRDFNEVATKFIDYLNVHYPNFEVLFGHPIENQVAITYFENIQSELMDACVTMKLQTEDFVFVAPQHDVIPLPVERYAEYAIFHDRHNPNMYWNSKRLFEHLDIWKIYVVMDQNKIVGSLFVKCVGVDYEIFGLSIDEAYENKGLELDLLSVSLGDCLCPSTQSLLFFVDEDNLAQIEATLKVGFKQIDTYRCYKVKL